MAELMCPFLSLVTEIVFLIFVYTTNGKFFFLSISSLASYCNDSPVSVVKNCLKVKIPKTRM